MKISITKNGYYPGRGLWIALKPFYICFQNKKKTIGFHFFNRNRIGPRPKYTGFRAMIGFFSNHGYCHWIELTILNWIASLRIDTMCGKKSFETWKRKEGII